MKCSGEGSQNQQFTSGRMQMDKATPRCSRSVDLAVKYTSLEF